LSILLCEPLDSPAKKAGACSRFTLHFDRLSVLSLSMEATPSSPYWKVRLRAVERVKSPDLFSCRAKTRSCR